METLQLKINELIEKAGLGYEGLGPCESIASRVEEHTVRLWDDYESVTLTRVRAISVLSELAGCHPQDAYNRFWVLAERYGI